MTATSFVLMGLTGLVLIYGKPLLIPLIGEPAFGDVAYWCAWLHMAFAVPFVLGILIMIALWLMQNLPTWVDWEWLKRGGGIIGHDHPPAYKFNAGQKIFWIVTLGGLVMLASGLSLMFPFYWFGYLRHAVGADCSRRAGAYADRGDHRPHLYRHHRHGRRLRRDVARRGRSQLGEGASQPLV